MTQEKQKESKVNEEIREEMNEYLEEDSSAVSNDASALTPEEMLAKIQEITEEKEKLYNQFLLSEADMKNTRRRAEIDVTNARKYALEKFVKELLPIIDAIELEIDAVSKNDTEELKQFKEGSELTYKMLLSACEKFGVKQIKPIGEKLNPELHQAVTMQKSRDVESNHVIHVVQNGYLLNDRLIRAAQVIVAE